VLLVEVFFDKVNQGFVVDTDWEVRQDVQETHSFQGLYGTSGGSRCNATECATLYRILHVVSSHGPGVMILERTARSPCLVAAIVPSIARKYVVLPMSAGARRFMYSSFSTSFAGAAFSKSVTNCGLSHSGA
jgi:hypothetical protein